MLTPFDIHKILDEEGKRGVKIFQSSISSVKATGKTADSARYVVEGKESKMSLEILARPFTPVLETGSKPAKTLKPSKEMLEELKPWAQVRGIPEDKVYGVAVNLLKNGQKVNRKLYSDKMDEFADQVADRITKEYVGYAVNNIVKAFEK